MFNGVVYLASDHAGYTLKGSLKSRLQGEGVSVVDCGPEHYDAGDDYPDFVEPAMQKLLEDPTGRAVIVGKTGEGEAMDANRFKHIRAAVYLGGPVDVVKFAREHNDANVLSLGADFVSEDDAWTAVYLFLTTPFSGDARHVRRNAKLDD